MTTIKGNGPRVAPPSTASVSAPRSVAPTSSTQASTGFSAVSSFGPSANGGGSVVNNLPAPPRSLASASTGTADLSRSIPLVKEGVTALEERGGSDATRMAELLKKPMLKKEEREELDKLAQSLGIENGSPEAKAMAMRDVMEGFIKSMLAEADKAMQKLAEPPKPPPQF